MFGGTATAVVAGYPKFGGGVGNDGGPPPAQVSSRLHQSKKSSNGLRGLKPEGSERFTGSLLQYANVLSPPAMPAGSGLNQNPAQFSARTPYTVICTLRTVIPC